MGDDGEWEVRVVSGAGESELRISADGSRVVARGDTDSPSSEDRRALEAASTTMANAVRTAVAAHSGGDVDEVDIEQVSGGTTWRVSFDGDAEVLVSLADGSVVREAG